MSAMKHHLHQRDEEEQELYSALLDYLAENEELFQQLATTKEWLEEEVIGYEE